MSTFSLSQTGTEINSAIGKVHNADTAPTEGSTNMVTSGGVHTAVNNVGVDALPITTENEGIANYDTDDKVPTNAAVKDYVDSKTGGIATYSAPDINNNRHGVDPIGISKVSDPNNIGPVSNSYINISAGLYFIELTLNAGNRYNNDSFAYYVNIYNSVRNRRLAILSVSNTYDTSAPYPAWEGSFTFYAPVNTALKMEVRPTDQDESRHYMNNFSLTLVKMV